MSFHRAISEDSEPKTGYLENHGRLWAGQPQTAHDALKTEWASEVREDVRQKFTLSLPRFRSRAEFKLPERLDRI